jgi:hypothetical protein
MTTLYNTFPDVTELLFNDRRQLHDLINAESKIRISKAFEGTLMRVEYVSSTCSWRIVTQRGVDAYKSCWGHTLSFGQRFERIVLRYYESMSDFFQDLDVRYNYTFLLTNGIFEYIANGVPESCIYTGRFINRVWECETVQTRLPQQEFLDVTTIDDLDVGEYMIFTTLSEQMQVFRLISEQTIRARKIRNGDPDIIHRYFELRVDMDKLMEFVNLYPNYAIVFNHCEIVIHHFATFLYLHIHKSTAKLPSVYLKLIDSICTEYSECTLLEIIDFLNNQSPNYLYTIVSQYKMNVLQQDPQRVWL